MYWIKGKDGKEYAVSFTQVVFMQLAMAEGVAMNNLPKMLNSFLEWPVGRVMRMYWLAVKNGMRKAGKDFTITEEDFIYWLDDDDTLMDQIVRAFNESMPGDDGEKKQTARQKK
jgi:hypothetical protein